ncbi:MAG: BatD family protein [Gemmatimonadota bacterium]|nr:BatD family protein [Gemmatimonadota bacterium]
MMTMRGLGPRWAVATLCVGVTMLFDAAPSSAQAEIVSTLDTALVTVGDRISLQVTVDHPGDAAVVWPDSLDLTPFEVLEARAAPTRSRGDRSISSSTFTLTAFELGQLEVPSFSITVLHPDGREETLETDRFGVEVVSVGVDEAGDIRDIRGPIAIPRSLLALLAWALLFMLFGAGAVVAFRRYWEGRHADEGIRPGPPPRPPHEIALEQLRRVQEARLLESGQIKEYHIRVSEIIRRFVEEVHHVRALEMTTWEVIDGLTSAGVDEGMRRDLRRFLDQCDLVKFAKVRPDDLASRAVLSLARDIVERSAAEPRAAPPVEPELAGTAEPEEATP